MHISTCASRSNGTNIAVFYYSQEHKVESVIPKCDGKSSLISLREKWLNFIQKCTQPTRDCNKAMIMLSSVIYDILMRKVHEWSLGDKSKEITNTLDPEAIVYENLAEADSDDVYYRFGGASISDMLHLRYKRIKEIKDRQH